MAETNWQPIETAPSVRCLVFGKIDDDPQRTGVWMTTEAGVFADNRFLTDLGYIDGDSAAGVATHWMPLPDPPTTTEDSK